MPTAELSGIPINGIAAFPQPEAIAFIANMQTNLEYVGDARSEGAMRSCRRLTRIRLNCITDLIGQSNLDITAREPRVHARRRVRFLGADQGPQDLPLAVSLGPCASVSAMTPTRLPLAES